MRRLSLALVLLCVIGIRLQGHHSISGVYDTSKEIRVDALVREFHFVNPHPFLTAEIMRAGKAELWKLEMDNRYELVNIGMSENTFRPGDRLVVSGSPGRSETKGIYIRRLDRAADGYWYEQVGTEPRMKGATR